MRVLHLADLHLDSPMRGLRNYDGAPELAASATREAFANAVRFALDRGVDVVLIAGDAYDGDWNDFSTGMFYLRELAKLCAAGTAVVVIYGNHDRASGITGRLSFPAGVKVLSDQAPETYVVPGTNLAVHGQSYAQREVLDNLVKHYPARLSDHLNIGLLHTGLTGHDGHDPYAPAALDDLARLDYDYWALGHIHIRGAVSGAPSAWYAGCVQGRSIRETGAHGGLLVTLEPGEPVRVEPQDFDVLRFALIELDCGGVSSRDELLARSRECLSHALANADGRPLAARLRLFGEAELHRRLLAEPEELVAELRLAWSEAAPDQVWLGEVSIDTTAPASVPVEVDPELAAALDGASAQDDTVDDLGEVLDTLLRKLPKDLLADTEPLGWLADRGAALQRLLMQGRASLERELGLISDHEG